jgi:ATP-dependent RNA helicase DDX27
MKHEAEIYSRPAKTWFQTAAEKEAAKTMGEEKYHDRDDAADAEAKKYVNADGTPMSRLDKLRMQRDEAKAGR